MNSINRLKYRLPLKPEIDLINFFTNNSLVTTVEIRRRKKNAFLRNL